MEQSFNTKEMIINEIKIQSLLYPEISPIHPDWLPLSPLNLTLHNIHFLWQSPLIPLLHNLYFPKSALSWFHSTSHNSYLVTSTQLNSTRLSFPSTTTTTSSTIRAHSHSLHQSIESSRPSLTWSPSLTLYHIQFAESIRTVFDKDLVSICHHHRHHAPIASRADGTEPISCQWLWRSSAWPGPPSCSIGRLQMPVIGEC